MPISTPDSQSKVEMHTAGRYRLGGVAAVIAAVALAVLAPSIAHAQDDASTGSEGNSEAKVAPETADAPDAPDDEPASEDASEEEDADDDSKTSDAPTEAAQEESADEEVETSTGDDASQQPEADQGAADESTETPPVSADDDPEDTDSPREEGASKPVDTPKQADAPEEAEAAPAVDASQQAESPEDGQEDAKGGVKAGYDSGFYVETADGNHKLELSGGFTPRFTVTDVEEPSSEGDQYQFEIPRARVKVSGHVFTPRLEWELGLGLAGRARLLSANIEYEILEDTLYFYAGQDRLPYMREQLNSHWRLHFAERSIVEDQFGEAREPGIALHNFKRDGFEWSVGLYNGVKSKLPTNPPDDVAERMFEPSVVARIGWSSKGLKGYTEGDIEGGPLRFGVGLSALSQLALPEEAERADKVGLDVVLKAHGFSFVAAGHTAARSAGDGFFDQEIFVSGLRAQAGYVIASRFEPVVRYAVVIPSADDTSTQEARGGLNVYFYGHRVKLQADAGTVTRRTPGVESTDWSGRLQGVLRF